MSDFLNNKKEKERDYEGENISFNSRCRGKKLKGKKSRRSAGKKIAEKEIRRKKSKR